MSNPIDEIIPIFSQFSKTAHATESEYQTLYNYSIRFPEAFWAKQAEHFISWFKKWDKVNDSNFKTGKIAWFEGSQLNVSYNCLDRHLSERPDQTAILWIGDTPGEIKKITYQALYESVCRFANVLISLGIKAGDRVCIYLPMIPEAAIAMLACTRIGAVHSVVFSGFSAEALLERVVDAHCRLIITADESLRGGKTVPLKRNVEVALKENNTPVEKVIVIKRTGGTIPWCTDRDHWYHELIENASPVCEATALDAGHPLFILYTSGSTGKPKGILHSTAGYLVYVATTQYYIFDSQPQDIFWCTADIGWITGHSYAIYGPLLLGSTTLIYEGLPTYPTASRVWEIVDEHQVTVFYTAPTLIRSLMALGEEPVKKSSRHSLRLLGSVGEPINPEAWKWYFEVIGKAASPIVDTWWQTETGGILIAPLPGATFLKPGSATLPFFGIEPVIINNDGQIVEGEGSGFLVIKSAWPGLMCGIYNNPARFLETYFAKYPGYYLTGDSVRRDKQGYLWIIGRTDDIIKVSGHRIGSAEVENALVQHNAVAEAAVVGIPHPIKGEAIYAFIRPIEGVLPSSELEKKLILQVREKIGAIASPEKIQWVPDLPKTRSGKIMRRILKKIAASDTETLGDITTLVNPEIVEKLINKS